MFNTLADAIAFHTAQAGPDYLWEHATVPNSRPRSDAFPGLRAWLWDYAGGVCAACGDDLDGEVEVCHIVAARDPKKFAKMGCDVDASGNRGYSTLGGNLYLGHRGCNVKDGQMGPVVPLASFVAPECIPLTYPTRSQMVMAMAREDKAAIQASRDARRERLMREAEEA